MTIQTSGRVQKFLLDVGGTPPEGRTLDKLQLFLPDGTAVDVSGGGGGGGYQGLWQPDTDYSAGSLVGIPKDDFETSHQAFLYGTDVDILAGTAIPGVDALEMVYADGPGGSAPSADYNRIHPGAQSYDYVDGFAYFFFDLSVGGDILVSSTVIQQLPVVYNFAGEQLFSGGLSIPATLNDVPPDRYFVALQNGQGGAGTETVTLTLSDGAAIPDPDVFWQSLG